MTVQLLDQFGNPLALAKKRPVVGEIGGTGTSIFDSKLGETDYNAALQGTKGYAIYDKMRFSDPQVRSALAVMKLPLVQADWFFEPASEDPKDVDVAQFCEEGLIRGMSTSWKVTLRQILLMLDYGSMPFETVWQIENRMVQLRKLAPRLPASITEWKVDEHGGFNGLKQQVTKDSMFAEVDIPPEKLVLFVNDQEGSNFRGVSVLRAAFMPYTMKGRFIRIDGIAKEKRAMGVDVGTMFGDDTGTAEKLEQALMSLAVHEKQYFIEQKGEWEYRLEGLRGAVLDTLGSINYHDVQIVRAVLAEFLSIGGDSGSLALHRDKTSFFVMALGAIADIVKDTINRHLIRRWVDMNFVVDAYPTLQHSRLDTRNVKEVAEAVATLVGANVIQPDNAIEDKMRADMELPERQEDAEDRPAPPDKPDPNAPGPEEGESTRTFRREPKGPEQFVDWTGLARTLDGAESKIVRAVGKTRTKQTRKMGQLAADVWRKGPDALDRITVPFTNDLVKPIADELMAIYEAGRRAATQELTRQGMSIEFAALDPTDSAIVAKFFNVKAKAVAGIMADKIKASFVFEMLDQFKKGIFDKARIVNKIDDLSLRTTKTSAALSVTEALNLGKKAVAEENADDIQAVLFSSLLDEGTCFPCTDADGSEFQIGTDDYEEHQPPYRECLGQNRCRCVYIFVHKGEAE